jgi:rusticyanin
MTVTATPPQTGPSEQGPGPHRRRLVAIIAAAVLAAGGLGAGLALSLGGSSAPTTASASSAYAYYQSMMGGYGIGTGSMMGRSGYTWMMGGMAAPGWMTGASLPGFMMGTNGDPGRVMGALFADAPGPRVTPSEATGLGNQVSSGAVIDRAANRISFTASTVQLAVLASPAGGPDETFRIAGLVNPTIVVPQGARVSIQVVNADPDTAHGLVITGSQSAWSPMPMMTSTPAFAGAALWILGNPTSAGMHTATITFTASAAGTYQYICAVPGHAQKGMIGTFIVG